LSGSDNPEGFSPGDETGQAEVNGHWYDSGRQEAGRRGILEGDVLIESRRSKGSCRLQKKPILREGPFQAVGPSKTRQGSKQNGFSTKDNYTLQGWPQAASHQIVMQSM